MATDQNTQSRRPHYHRGRRGPDRRGSDRRAGQPPEQPARSGDQVDVEQIMRDIRARIAQRHGIELSTQQIQELAARRLEAILDPRTVNPALMQQLRRGAGAAADVTPAAPDPGYTFESTTLYDSHRAVMRFIRRLLNPILKLFFNPNPLVHALHTQGRLNREAAAREAERERLQTEWNALHYEILQRLVTEVSRASVEMQSLSQRIESLAARVDFNDRRVRSLESPPPAGQSRPHPRPAEPQAAAQTAPPPAESAAAEGTPADTSAPEGSRRRRRRRRGRRGGGAPLEAGATAVVVGGSEGLAGPDTADIGDAEEGEEIGASEIGATEVTDDVADVESAAVPEAIPQSPAAAPAPTPAPAPAPAMAEQLSSPPDQPTPPRDEPAPLAPEPPDPGPPDR